MSSNTQIYEMNQALIRIADLFIGTDYYDLGPRDREIVSILTSKAYLSRSSITGTIKKG
jgi:hypothetical protein